MPETIADCVIVGGGIGGAVLALALGQRGYSVVILERGLNPTNFGRPEVLARTTMEAFDRFGAGSRIRQEAAIPLKHLELCQSGRGQLLQLTQEDFQRADAQPYSTDPARTRRMLLEAAATSQLDVHRGVEVHALIRHGGFTEVQARCDGSEQAWRTRLVVGDDGGRSIVRAAVGIPLQTQELPVEFLGAAGPALPGQPADGGQAWFNPSGLHDGLVGGVFMPLPGQRSTLALLITPEARARLTASPARFYTSAEKLSPLCKGLERFHRFPEGFGMFRRPFGHAPRYVSDGVALLGDAVHPVTPAGGQGANMSVADALVLAEVAAEALAAGDCSAQRLAAYEAQRRPANARSLQFSARANQGLRIFAVLPWLWKPLVWSLGRINGSPETKIRFLRAVSRAFVQTLNQDG